MASLVCKMSPQPCTHTNWRQSIVPIHRRCTISSRCKVDLPPGKQNSSFLTLPWPPPRTQPPWVRSKLPRIQKSPPTVCRPMCVPVLSVFGSYLGKPTLSCSSPLDFVGWVHGVRCVGPSTVASDVGATNVRGDAQHACTGGRHGRTRSGGWGPLMCRDLVAV